MEEEHKIADNRTLELDQRSKYRQTLDSFNDKIDLEKNKIRNLEDVEDVIVSLNKSVNDCVQLLRESMKGKAITNKLNSIEESNAVNLNKTIGDIDIRREEINNRIVELNHQKEDFEKEYREKNKEVKEEGE